MGPLRIETGNRLNLLCLGAHGDDIEIGCGGSILRLLDDHPTIDVTWVVFSATREREREARISAEDYLAGAANARIAVFDFADGRFPQQADAIKTQFETLKQSCAPDLIFTHHPSDAHQDHRTIAELTQQTFRAHTVFGYEIPKVDGDLGNPNVFVALTREQCERKIERLHRHFPSQAGRHWFESDLFRAMLRLRGMHAVAPAGWAEGFYCRKLVM